MIFSEPVFFVFFAVYLLFHFLTPSRYRLYLIIVGGTIFYSHWNPYFVFLPFLLLFVAFYGGLWIERAKDLGGKKTALGATIVALLIPLFVFKYTNFFFVDVLGLVMPVQGPLLDLALPLGVSFITFTLIAYAVDVFKQRFAAERSLAVLAGHVLFFPHLIAGPILRPHELIPQLKAPRPARQARFLLGTTIFTIGLVKKLVFADQISILVDRVYAGGEVLAGLDYVLAIYGFSLQIYCDFSGYTDMAIGLAILLRIRLPNNFSRPYSAASLVEFWRLWHITLSFWLRDYLYIPLGGNKRGFARQVINIVVTMALGGLWHGANWTFVLWGLLHGGAISLAHLLRRFRMLRWLGALPRWLAVILTFHFVTFAWVFFRASDLATVRRVLAGPFTSGWGDPAAALQGSLFPIALILVFLATHAFDSHARLRVWAHENPPALVIPALAALWILAIVISAGSSAKFIYFDF